MPTINLTDQTIKALKTAKRAEFFDDDQPGLCIRVTETGHKSWGVYYRFAGRLQRIGLGNYPVLSLKEARKKARAALNEVANDRNPATAIAEGRQAETFKALATEYMERHSKLKKRSWPEDQRILDYDLLPYFGSMRAKEITRRDVRSLLDRKAATAPTQANRLRAALNKIFNWGILNEYVDSNPVHLVPRPAQEHRRERVLTEDELKNLWKATEELRPDTKAIFRLLLLTAQRSGEVRGMQWTELDLDRGWWTIPGGRTKNKLTHRVPLSPQAVWIISGMKTLADQNHTRRQKRNRSEDPPSPYVFQGRKPNTCFQWIGKAAEELEKKSGVEFTPHDLRRTAASLMTGMGIPRLVVSKILNHVEPGITAVYDRHGYDAEKREALEAWARKLMIMVSDLQAVEKSEA